MTAVREATADDAAAVQQVWASVAAEGEWIGSELPLRSNWQETFREGIADPRTGWFVAEVSDDVVGGIFVHDQFGIAHIGMAIVDGHRGAGLGRQLLHAAIEWARGAGCHKMQLEVWPHNERALALYRRAGFAEEGLLRRHYRRRNGELWDAVVMGLLLDDEAPGRP
jgi:RimJ/RimL family protein N-acetyltransferase